MADYTHTNLPVHGRHVPSYSTETDSNGVKHQVELPGIYQVGVEIEGVWHPIYEAKAGKLLSKLAAARKALGGSGTSSQ